LGERRARNPSAARERRGVIVLSRQYLPDPALVRNRARQKLPTSFTPADAPPAASNGALQGRAVSPSLHHYRVIYADPPSSFATFSRKGKGRSAEAHYDCMGLDEIKVMPVADWAAGDCALFLWATDPLLPRAFEVIAAWGFVYKTVAFTWVKTTQDGTGFPIGCGFWTRANPELCLLATRGRPQRISRSVRQLILAPRQAHSQKPEEVYERIGRWCLVPISNYSPGSAGLAGRAGDKRSKLGSVNGAGAQIATRSTQRRYSNELLQNDDYAAAYY
jgi:N6-adenosine-specific RNA methylase IME4